MPGNSSSILRIAVCEAILSGFISQNPEEIFIFHGTRFEPSHAYIEIRLKEE